MKARGAARHDLSEICDAPDSELELARLIGDAFDLNRMLEVEVLRLEAIQNPRSSTLALADQSHSKFLIFLRF